MMINKMKIGWMFILLCSILLMDCRKHDHLAPPDILVNFEANSFGIAAAEDSIIIKLKLTSATTIDVPVIINVIEDHLQYDQSYTSTPAVSAGKITVTIPAGNNETQFTIKKKPGIFYTGDEKLNLEIYSSSSPVIIGAVKNLELSFSEIVATNVAAIINGGGPDFPNKVFIDLSANRQNPVLRTSWDLGFYTGPEFNVILNSSTAMMAKQLNKNDLSLVSANDTLGFASAVSFSLTNPSPAALPYIDYPDGNLSRTAISPVSATASENKVYIINRGTGVGNPAPERGWKKIRILRNASGGYSLQYADIAATNYNTLEIPKQDPYYFNYVSFDNGLLNVEPEKDKWDFAWTYFSNVLSYMGTDVPYLYQDFILINRNVSACKVMMADKSFENFSADDINGLIFSSAQNAIGADWRSGGGPTTLPFVRTDRYYIIKDGDSNYYKLRFTALTQNNERGYPAFEAVWLKKG
ncbi:MAG: hypothetical protein IPL97_06570 [Niastella sp.]|nr:hypothetical protein [Niastella sp.]